jgi:hypothetical protein
METQAMHDQILTAIKQLNDDNSDGTRERNGIGFNRNDSEYGRKLANKESLTDRELVSAIKMLRKYQGQIGSWIKDVPLLDLPDPSNNRKVSRIGKDSKVARFVFMWEGFKDPQHNEIAPLVKTVARWNPDKKYWIASPSSNAFDVIATLHDSYCFTVSDGATDLLSYLPCDVSLALSTQGVLVRWDSTNKQVHNLAYNAVKSAYGKFTPGNDPHWIIDFDRVSSVISSLGDLTLDLGAGISELVDPVTDSDLLASNLLASNSLASNSLASELLTEIETQFGDGKTLYPHQIEAVQWLLSRHNKKAILALDMGLGKTASSLAAIRELMKQYD